MVCIITILLLMKKSETIYVISSFYNNKEEIYKYQITLFQVSALIGCFPVRGIQAFLPP